MQGGASNRIHSNFLYLCVKICTLLTCHSGARSSSNNPIDRRPTAQSTYSQLWAETTEVDGKIWGNTARRQIMTRGGGRRIRHTRSKLEGREVACPRAANALKAVKAVEAVEVVERSHQDAVRQEQALSPVYFLYSTRPTPAILCARALSLGPSGHCCYRRRRPAGLCMGDILLRQTRRGQVRSKTVSVVQIYPSLARVLPVWQTVSAYLVSLLPSTRREPTCIGSAAFASVCLAVPRVAKADSRLQNS